jgi:hypothetical protein
MCLYCRAKADQKSAVFMRLTRDNQRREFFVARCRDCAKRQQRPVGAFGCLTLVLLVATVGLLIGGIWYHRLFIFGGLAAVGFVVFLLLANRAHGAEWSQIGPPVLKLIGEGWQPR